MKKVRRQAAIFCIRFSGGQRLALFRRLCYIGSGGERTMKKLLGFFLAVFILVSPALAAGGNTVVYITRTGECYHTGSCRYLKKSKIEITLADAVARGYRACKVCCPPSLDGEERQGHAFAGSGQADSTPSPSAFPRRRQPHQRLPPLRHRPQRRRRTLRPRRPAREAGCSGPPAVRPLRRVSTRFPGSCQTPLRQGGEKVIKSNKMAGMQTHPAIFVSQRILLGQVSTPSCRSSSSIRASSASSVRNRRTYASKSAFSSAGDFPYTCSMTAAGFGWEYISLYRSLV